MNLPLEQYYSENTPFTNNLLSEKLWGLGGWIVRKKNMPVFNCVFKRVIRVYRAVYEAKLIRVLSPSRRDPYNYIESNGSCCLIETLPIMVDSQ